MKSSLINTFPVKVAGLLLIAPGLFISCAQGAPVSTLASSPAPRLTSPVADVNPFVGTAEHGHTFPGATVPFGMVQVSPDTPLQGWDGSSGYHYSDSEIHGFSHTHLSGTGVGGLGDVLLMPTVGDVHLNKGAAGKGDGYTSKFSHEREEASPNYYRVFLDNSKVTVELSATERAAIHRYTFPATQNAHVVLDLESGVGNRVAESGLKIENSTTISGFRHSDGWGGRREVYFVMEFSKPFASYGIERDGTRLPNGDSSSNGKAVKAFVSYQTGEGEQVLVKVGISGTSIEGARKNLSAEIPNFDFNAVRTAGVNKWSNLLGSLQIETKDPKVRRTFYSNLYLSFLSPTLFNDADGTYRGADHKNHQGKSQNYSTFSLWDTFRAQNSLLTIMQPNRMPDMVDSLVAFYRERGQQEMPVWTFWGNETGTMIGYNSAPVVVESFLKGIGGSDPEEAYQALKATALNPRNGQDEYARYGYVLSTGGSKQSVARTLEFAYDDWCIAQMAQKLGHTADAQRFFNRSANFMNVFDSERKFMRGRLENGSWRRPFDPVQVQWSDYTEANAWHYTWGVMHDSPMLVKLMGGDKAFVDKMESMFNASSDLNTNLQDITGLIGQYAQGNEPVHHAAYLYNSAGAPYKTQQRVHDIMGQLYNDTPAGSPGNNDCGQMSAWYVFSAMGFYPVNPASGVYVIGSPLVDKATLRLDQKRYGGRTFTVETRNNSPKNIYIQSAMLNGKPLTKTYFTHDQLLAGGTLRLDMGPNPNVNWGRDVASRPPSGMPANFAYPALPKSSLIPKYNWTLPIRVVPGADAPVDGFLPDLAAEEGGSNNNGNTIDTSAPNAAPQGVYQWERYGSKLTFSYPVPKDATYTVRLHFAEIFGAAPGKRMQNVSINGRPVLTNFSISAEVGQNKALVKEFTGVAPDASGNIVIRVTAAPGSEDSNAKISGIEILKP